MGVVHDLICPACGRGVDSVLVTNLEYPTCSCGERMTWKPSKMNYFGFGRQIYSDAADTTFSNQHEKEIFMAKRGWQVAGDKVGGAREVTNIKNSSFHYKGQGSHVSTGERRAAREHRRTLTTGV